MSFLNQILLVGLAASAIPIIIHLLNKRRFKRVPWAATRFVKTSIKRRRRRMRLQDWILLATRCLLIALLAVALARPAVNWLQTNFFSSSTVATAIILDRSASMATNERFSQAKQAATQTIDALPSGSTAAIFLSANSADSGITEPTSDLRLARDTIEKASLSDRPTDLQPAIEKALEVLSRSQATEKEIVLITDGQASGWKNFEPILKALAAEQDIRLNIALIGSSEPTPNNLGISDLRQTSTLTPAGQAIRFEVSVTNYSNATATQIPVTLSIDNAPAGEPFVIDTLPAGETRNITLYATLPSAGYHRATAAIRPDGMPADDQRTIVLRASEAINILLVDGQPGRSELDSETLFLRNALVPVPPEARENYFIKTRRVTVPDLSPNIFTNNTATVLANVAELPTEIITALEKYIQQGGGLIIFPGSNTKAKQLNRSLAKLLPATLGETIDGPLHLQSSNYSHPITALWNDPGSGSLAEATFQRAFELTLSEKSRTVLSFEGGKPAITERDFGLGKVFLFASSADTAWNDLPIQPAFLPLSHRLLGAIVARHETALNLPTGTPFKLQLAAELAGAEAIITNPQNQSISETLGSDATFNYAKTDRAGAYEATIANPPTLAPSSPLKPDPNESQLALLTEPQIRPPSRTRHHHQSQ